MKQGLCYKKFNNSAHRMIIVRKGCLITKGARTFKVGYLEIRYNNINAILVVFGIPLCGLHYKHVYDCNGTAHFESCLNTKIYSFLETAGGQSSNLCLNAAHFFNTSVN
jgi:hypothetical protein